MTTNIALWRATGHQWGPGKVHAVAAPGDKTECGKALIECPGRPVAGVEMDCRSCAKVIATREDRERQRVEWELRDLETQRQREEQSREWWASYDRYLASPSWRRKRALVMARCAGQCEGCGQWPASQVHHLRYPRSEPGSPAWIEQEMLFDLIGVCEDCHEAIHGRELDR